MPLTFLLAQTADNWQLTTASESVVIFKPKSTDDPTAAICFVPREDKPQEKVYAILQGNSSQQDLFFQSEIDPARYLAVSISMWELMFVDGEFDL